jgi:uncharacterized protein
MQRDLQKQILIDLDKKIVLLAGPRQVGKTTLSKSLFNNFEYLNFDSQEDRKTIRDQSWNRNSDLIVFDELHKMTKWKSWIKGVYDKEHVRPRLLATGSARMDIFRRGGDSLAGRHFLHRMHPFSVAELKDQIDPQECLSRLMRVGGFPEPFLSDSVDFSKRWRSTHLERILKEDLLELEYVRNLKLMEILLDLLSERVGSTISFSSLARDLEISPHTVKKWIGILESLYVIFVVSPFSKNLARAILKEPKIYFFDVGRVKNDEGARFENVVACALLRKIQRGQDQRGEKSELYYIKDKEKREVDFLTVVDRKIKDMVEVKTSDHSVSSHLRYFSERLRPQNATQVVLNLKKDFSQKSIEVVKASPWLLKQD